MPDGLTIADVLGERVLELLTLDPFLLYPAPKGGNADDERNHPDKA
ncbi:hypothetical protein [Brevibacillus formosus]|nr:hypothetical protein [Brevibacillus formosus]